MAYVQNKGMIGKKVRLTTKKESCSGYFEIGSEVQITARDEQRGYTFEDEFGNKVIEAGFSGFEEL